MKNEEQFKEWWAEVAPVIERRVSFLVGNEAQDIIQEVSVMAVIRFDEFDNIDEFGRWCHQRSHWLALDEIGRRKRFAKELRDTPAEDDSEERRSTVRLLYELIEELPNRQRSISLDKMRGYTNEEIAQRYRVKETTVRSLWRHAKQNLTKYLEERTHESH